MSGQRLHFVDLSEDLRANKPSTRRAVRSQAQRHSRNRQRLERAQAAESSLPDRSRASTSAQAQEQERSQGQAQPFAGQYINDDTSPPGTRRSSGGGASDSGRIVELEDNFEESVIASSPDVTIKSPRDIVHRQALVRHARQIPSTPSTWGTETADPFRSPLQLDRMFRMAMIQLKWLRPHVNIDIAQRIICNAYDEVPNVMILSSILLAATGHLDAMSMQPDHTMRNDSLFKGRLLSEVQKRVAVCDAYVEDTTIEVLCNLTSFELSRVSRDATTHLRGIQTLVQMKGGMHTIKLVGLQMMLECLDLAHALVFDEPLLHIDSSEVAFAHLPAEPTLQAAALFASLTSLVAAEFQDLAARVQHEDFRGMQSFPTLLRNAAACLATVRPDGAVDNVRAQHFGDSLVTLSADVSAVRTHTGTGHDIDLANACQMMLAILYNLIVRRFSFSSPQNQNFAQGLHAAVRTLSSKRIWREMPIVRGCLVVTGIAACSNPSSKSYFTSSLTNLMCFFGPTGWSKTKNTTLTFLRMRSALEIPQRNARGSIEGSSGFSPRPYTAQSMTTSVKPWSAAPIPPSTPDYEQVDTQHHHATLRQHGSSPVHLDSLQSSASPSSMSARSTSIVSSMRSSSSPQPEPETLTELQKFDRGFHLAMFKGDFWFTDTNKEQSSPTSGD